VALTGNDKETVSRAEHNRRPIKVDLKTTFDNVSDMPSCAPIRFNKFASEFNETNLSAVLFVDFEADSDARRIPVQGFEVDSLQIHLCTHI
jgi:hypothetical protein